MVLIFFFFNKRHRFFSLIAQGYQGTSMSSEKPPDFHVLFDSAVNVKSPRQAGPDTHN